MVVKSALKVRYDFDGDIKLKKNKLIKALEKGNQYTKLYLLKKLTALDAVFP